MCTRITLTVPDAATLIGLLGLDPDPVFAAGYHARFNVAPTQPHWIVTADHPRRLVASTWALGPQRQLNTRIETLRERGFVRGLAPCAVPADGFLEWEGGKEDRQPVLFQRPDHRPMLLAGVHDGLGFSVVTMDPDDTVGAVHDRMPLILPPDDWRAWLELRDVENFASPPRTLLAPRRVSRRVNSSTHDDAACLADASTDGRAQQLKLF